MEEAAPLHGGGAVVEDEPPAVEKTIRRATFEEPRPPPAAPTRRSPEEASLDGAGPVPAEEMRRGVYSRALSSSRHKNTAQLTQSFSDIVSSSVYNKMGGAAFISFEGVKSIADLSTAQVVSDRILHRAFGWTINPITNQWVHHWDVLLALALLYTAIVTPFEVGFIRGRTEAGGLFYCNLVVNVVFVGDVILQFFLHYQLPKSRGFAWVREHDKIVVHYLRGWFLLDVISTIPFGLISLFVDEAASLKGIRLIRLLRLTKLIRVLRGSALITRYRADLSVSMGSVSLMKFVLLTIIASHFFACVWGFAGNASSKRNSWLGDWKHRTENTLGAAALGGVGGGTTTGGSVLFGAADQGSSSSRPPAWDIDNPKNQYVLALYYSLTTLTTVGYGDVTPRNLGEYGVMIVAMFFGGFMWAFVIGQVCATAATLDVKAIEHQQLYDQLNNMLVDMSISRPLARAVRSFVLQSEDMSRRMGYYHLMTFLSPELQCALCEEVSATRLGSVGYFKHRSIGFRLAVFHRMTFELYIPHEEIRESSLLIIANTGMIGANGRLYTKGASLNLDFLLKRARRLVPYMRALNYVEVELLSIEGLGEVLAEFPHERPKILWWRFFLSLIREVGDLRNGIVRNNDVVLRKSSQLKNIAHRPSSARLSDEEIRVHLTRDRHLSEHTTPAAKCFGSDVVSRVQTETDLNALSDLIRVAVARMKDLATAAPSPSKK